ncbi:MAG: NUDIX domain-containing protein [Chloroflexia bacterium]
MAGERFVVPVAVHLFLVRGEEVLLLRRAHTGYEDGKYSVIAGHLDGGETVVAAAVREALEEAGVVLDPAEVRVVGVMHRRANDERVDFFVATEAWSGEIANCEPHKCDALDWFPFEDLPGNTIPYVRRAIENWRAAAVVRVLGLRRE